MKKTGFSILIFLVIIISLISCGPVRKDNINSKKGNIIAAKIGDEHITTEDIDSLIEAQLYNMRKNILDAMISERLLTKEAKKQNISLDELVDLEINKKASPVTIRDIENFRNEEGLNYFSEKDLENNDFIEKQLTFKHRKQRQYQYVDSLKPLYDVEVYLNKKTDHKLDISRLENINSRGNKDSPVKIYFIFDFDCPVCESKKDIFINLYNKYKNEAHFYYVFYGPSDEYKNLVCEAAGRQGLFWEMYDFIASQTGPIEESVILSVSKSLHLDIDEFMADLKAPDIIRKIENNKRILVGQNIYYVPSIVIDGRLIEELKSQAELEGYIEEAIKKGSQ